MDPITICGNCGNAEEHVNRVLCPVPRSVTREAYDFKGHLRYDHPSTHTGCEMWIEAEERDLEAENAALADVAKRMCDWARMCIAFDLGHVVDEDDKCDVLAFQKELEHLGIPFD